jgi:hypothetical protein
MSSERARFRKAYEFVGSEFGASSLAASRVRLAELAAANAVLFWLSGYLLGPFRGS